METYSSVGLFRAREGRTIKVVAVSEQCSFFGDSKEVKRVTRALGGRGSDNGRGSEVEHDEGLFSFTFVKD